MFGPRDRMGMSDTALIGEKLEQAVRLLRETDTDCWLTVARETTEIDEPCLPFLLGFDVVWPTFVVVTPEDERHVVIGRHDAPNADALGEYTVHPYDESFEPALRTVIDNVDPTEIAVNYARDDVVADGLTHGMYLQLTDALAGTGYEDALVSARDVVARLRSEKSSMEYDRVARAADVTIELFDELAAAWTPTWTEADVSAFFHDRMRTRGLESAWSWEYCPTVHAGGDAPVGHTTPGDRTLPPGEVLHVDFGVKHRGYAADIQRLFYRPADGDGDDGKNDSDGNGDDGGNESEGDPTTPPADLRAAYDDVRAAIDAAFETVEPGVQGFEVDAAARSAITDRGWPVYEHAAGHNVGRNAHDGGTLLGPRWDRYGESPEGIVREGEIYTLELGVDTQWGYLGQEEMIEVTADGAAYLVEPQTELYTLVSQEGVGSAGIGQ